MNHIDGIRILFCVFFAWSAQKAGALPVDTAPVVISGRLDGIKNQTLYLISSRQAQHFNAYYSAIDSTAVDSTGYFELNFQTEHPDFFQLRQEFGFNLFGDKNLYLQSGDTLSIRDNAGEIILTGNAAPLNKLQWTLERKRSAGSNIRELVRLSPENFTDTLNNKRDGQIALLETVGSSLPTAYNRYLREQIDYHWANDYFYFLRYHYLYTQQKWKYYLADSLRYQFIRELDLSGADFKFTKAYHDVINGLLENAYQGATYEIPDSVRWRTELSDKYDAARGIFTGLDLEIALKNLSYNFGTYLLGDKAAFFAKASDIRDFFQEERSTEIYYAAFLDNYRAYLGLAPGKKAPAFSLPDPEGKSVSLQDFAGKVVYIDFWGTWCGPCIASLPKYRELQQQFSENEDVVFLNIALEGGEKDIERWKKFLQKEDFPGVHLVAEDQFRNRELQPYMLNFAPTYFLVGANGNILDPRAKTPEKVYEDIRSEISKER